MWLSGQSTIVRDSDSLISYGSTVTGGAGPCQAAVRCASDRPDQPGDVSWCAHPRLPPGEECHVVEPGHEASSGAVLARRIAGAVEWGSRSAGWSGSSSPTSVPSRNRYGRCSSRLLR